MVLSTALCRNCSYNIFVNLCLFIWEARSFPQYCVLTSSHIQMLCHIVFITVLVLVILGGQIFGLTNMISVSYLSRSSLHEWHGKRLWN